MQQSLKRVFCHSNPITLFAPRLAHIAKRAVIFEIKFSFQSRLGRLPFFLGFMALGPATVVEFVVLFAGVVLAAKRNEWAVVVLLGLALLPLAVAGLRCSLSRHVRRLRDSGWDPAIVIGSRLFAKVVDRLVLAHLLPRLATRSRIG